MQSLALLLDLRSAFPIRAISIALYGICQGKSGESLFFLDNKMGFCYTVLNPMHRQANFGNPFPLFPSSGETQDGKAQAEAHQYRLQSWSTSKLEHPSLSSLWNGKGSVITFTKYLASETSGT
jgi:hypothetical protein